MSFDNIAPQARSAQPELAADLLEIKSPAIRHGGSAPEGTAPEGTAPGDQTPLTAAEKTLRDALLATKANGGIPNEHAIDLFREAMTTSEKSIQESKQYLQSHSKLAGHFIDADQKLKSVNAQMDPDERKELAANEKAYLDGLVPKAKMEESMQNHYGKEYPNLVPALKELYAAQRDPNAPMVRLAIDSVPLLVQDRVTTAKFYGAALDAEANQRPLGELGFMQQFRKP